MPAGRAMWMGGPPEKAPIPCRSRAGLKFRGEIGLIGGCGLSLALRMRAVERGPDLAMAIQLRVAGSHAAVAPRVGAGTYPR